MVERERERKAKCPSNICFACVFFPDICVTVEWRCDSLHLGVCDCVYHCNCHKSFSACLLNVYVSLWITISQQPISFTRSLWILRVSIFHSLEYIQFAHLPTHSTIELNTCRSLSHTLSLSVIVSLVLTNVYFICSTCTSRVSTLSTRVLAFWFFYLNWLILMMTRWLKARRREKVKVHQSFIRIGLMIFFAQIISPVTSAFTRVTIIRTLGALAAHFTNRHLRYFESVIIFH